MRISVSLHRTAAAALQRCAGPPELTGAGEITRTGDSYDGHLTMTSAQGTMKMKMSGRRTGTCDDPK